MAPRLTVLRLGHRPQRDKRMTTHVFLTARAFGAEEAILTTQDRKVQGTVDDVVDRFGGPFNLRIQQGWRGLVRGFPGPSLHLTMYGEPHIEVLPRVQDAEEVLVVVGAEKVPGDLYDLVTHNVAVGNQPHSEVAALATVLHEIAGPQALYRQRPDARMVVEPQARGKQVTAREDATEKGP